MNIPNELKYTHEHEWVRIEGNIATIGITDFAQEQLGDIVFVEMNMKEQDVLEAGDVFGIVEAVKTVSDLFLPVSGTILEINHKLETNPEDLNSDAYEHWIIKVEISNPSQIDTLLSAEDYSKLITE